MQTQDIDDTEDQIRYKLKLLNRERVVSEEQLIINQTQLDENIKKVYPGIRDFLDESFQADPFEYVDFLDTFWHMDCVRKLKEQTFLERYERWCNRLGYPYSSEKALSIYEFSKSLSPKIDKDNDTKVFIKFLVSRIKDSKNQVIKSECLMDSLGKRLPEFETVLAIPGVTQRTAVEVISEIGCLKRFKDKKAFLLYTGLDGTKRYNQNRKATERLQTSVEKILNNLLSYMPENSRVYNTMKTEQFNCDGYKQVLDIGTNAFLDDYYEKVMNFYQLEAAKKANLEDNNVFVFDLEDFSV